MTEPIIVHRGRQCVLPVQFPYSLANDDGESAFKSQIRVGSNPNSELIAEWDIEFKKDDPDTGCLILSLSSATTGTVQATVGYMDIKFTQGGVPRSMFDKGPIQVNFYDMPTL